ncbi:MAG: MFS transporter [Candidatus Binatia bacterium]|nr:MFS transporter [Candidatus Binatia bacterium]
MASTQHERQQVFYGWWVVLAAAVASLVGYGPIISFTFGVFFKALSQEFGWSRAQTSLAFSLSILLLSGISPLVGRLVDRFGARRVILSSVVGFGLGVMSFSLLSASLWHFYTVYLLLGIVGVGTSPLPYASVISRWFDKRRGLALGVAMVGVGLGTLITPALAQTLIAAVGWRHAYLYLGLLVIVVALPVVGFFLKETPHLLGLGPDGAPLVHAEAAQSHHPEPGLSGAEALRTAAFWLMLAAFFLVSASVHGCLIHLVPLLTDRGLSTQSAAFATSLLGGAVLLGRVGTGYLLDRFLTPPVAVCFFCGTAGGIFLLWSEAAGGVVFLAAILLGLGLGAEGDLMAYGVSRYFGLRAFAEIYGYAFAAFGLGAVTGPLLMGGSFDLTGSYRLALGIFVAASLLAGLLMTRLGPYRVWQPTAQPAVADGA